MIADLSGAAGRASVGRDVAQLDVRRRPRFQAYCDSLFGPAAKQRAPETTRFELRVSNYA